MNEHGTLKKINLTMCLKEYFHHLKDFLNDFKKLQNDIFMRMFLGTPSHNIIMQFFFIIVIKSNKKVDLETMIIKIFYH